MVTQEGGLYLGVAKFGIRNNINLCFLQPPW